MRYPASMKLIINSALREFASRHPQAQEPLQAWRHVIERHTIPHWAALKALFKATDKVGDLTVFDIGGNKYRLIAFIRFEKQIVYVKHVLTHTEYDKGGWKK